jgi:hypothetical protein
MIARANGQARGARRGPYDTRSPSARIKALRCRRRGHDQAGTQSLRSNWGRRPVPKAKKRKANRIWYLPNPRSAGHEWLLVSKGADSRAAAATRLLDETMVRSALDEFPGIMAELN